MSQRWRAQWAVGCDLLRWGLDIRAHVPRQSRGSKCALLVDLESLYGTSKAEAVLATGLRRRGYRIVVLLVARSRAVEWMYRLAGIRDFVHADTLIDDPLRLDAEGWADGVLAATPDFAALLRLESGDVQVGRHVMSAVARRLRIGSIDPAVPAQRDFIRATLVRSFLAKAVAERVVAQVAPDLALFNERGYTPAGEAFDVCLSHGVDVIQWFHAPQPGTLAFKRYRSATRDMHPLALGDGTWDVVRRMPWGPEQKSSVLTRITGHYREDAEFNRQQLHLGKRIKQRAEVIADLGLDPMRKTAVIFAHILYDATFFYGVSLYQDYEQWLVETVRGAIGNPALNWIVKLHPVNVWRSKMDGQPMRPLEAEALHAALGTLPPHIRLMPADTDINTFALFGLIDYGLTVRGTIGTELPCFGIPVVTAGTGRYSGRGFTIDPPTREAYQAVLADLHHRPRLGSAEVEAAQRYAWATFLRRPVPIRTLEFEYPGASAPSSTLSINLRVRPPQSRHAAPADVERFADWATASNDDDFLAPIEVALESRA